MDKHIRWIDTWNIIKDGKKHRYLMIEQIYRYMQVDKQIDRQINQQNNGNDIRWKENQMHGQEMIDGGADRYIQIQILTSTFNDGVYRQRDRQIDRMNRYIDELNG